MHWRHLPDLAVLSEIEGGESVGRVEVVLTRAAGCILLASPSHVVRAVHSTSKDDRGRLEECAFPEAGCYVGGLCRQTRCRFGSCRGIPRRTAPWQREQRFLQAHHRHCLVLGGLERRRFGPDRSRTEGPSGVNVVLQACVILLTMMD